MHALQPHLAFASLKLESCLAEALVADQLRQGVHARTLGIMAVAVAVWTGAFLS